MVELYLQTFGDILVAKLSWCEVKKHVKILAMSSHIVPRYQDLRRATTSGSVEPEPPGYWQVRMWRPGEGGVPGACPGGRHWEGSQTTITIASASALLVKEALEAKERQRKLQQKEERQQKANAVVTIGVKSLVQVFMKRGLTSIKSKLYPLDSTSNWSQPQPTFNHDQSDPPKSQLWTQVTPNC